MAMTKSRTRLCSMVTLAVWLMLALSSGAVAFSQALQSVVRMAANESAAREQRENFSFISEERSTRTEAHLWRERVVETDQGAIRRLVAIDGRPLTPEQAAGEQHRLDEIIAHPAALIRLNENQRDDERHFTRLLALLPTAFIVTPDGTQDNCLRFAFHPSPAFHPSTYEERIVHAMEGTVSLHQPEDRLCTLQAHIAQPVEFGFGILGRINSGGHFGLERGMVAPGQWKTTRINVHVDGRIIMLKNLSRDQDSVRTEVHLVPQHLTFAEALNLTRP